MLINHFELKFFVYAVDTVFILDIIRVVRSDLCVSIFKV